MQAKLKAASLMGLTAVAALFLTASAKPAVAQVVIVPTYDISITSDPHAAQIEASINSICALYSKVFTNSNTIHVYFYGLPQGLGTTTSYLRSLTYSDYRTRLLGTSDIADILSPNLPSTGNPIPGNPTAGVQAGAPFARTLGYTSAPDDLGEPLDVINGVTYDNDITINTSICNLSRTGPQDPEKYDIISVTEHELNEVLGLNSGLTGQKNTPVFKPVIVSNVGSLDFFRYGAIGDNTTVHPNLTNTLSFTNNANAIAYFSLDGGNSVLNYFNQHTGGDFHDWASNGEAFVAPPQVQTAYSSPGIDVDLGPNELLALQACGYNLIQPAIANITGQVIGNKGGLVYNRSTKFYSQIVKIATPAGLPLLGPVTMILSGLPTGVTLVNKTGTTGGSPYTTVSSGDIVGGSILSVNLQFTNPSGGFITYSPTVMGGVTPGAAPK